MNCNGNCPYQNQWLGPQRIQQPIWVSPPRDGETIVDYARRIRREMSDLEKEFKKEEKKDDKPKVPTFNVFQVAGILTLGGPLVAALYLKLFHALGLL